MTAKRGYLKALQMDIQKYQKKNEDIVANIHNKISNHGKLAEIMLPNMIRVDEINWSEKVSELN